MKTVRRWLSAPTLLACAASVASVTVSGTAAAQEAARFLALVGHWKGHGELGQPGQAAAKLMLDYRCRKVSAGWAVSCELKAHNDAMSIAETDLFGTDAATHQSHWYAVTNQGESHDHLVEWTDARILQAHYAWSRDGRKMEEKITIRVDGARGMDFRSAVTEDGHDAGEFRGTLRR